MHEVGNLVSQNARFTRTSTSYNNHWAIGLNRGFSLGFVKLV